MVKNQEVPKDKVFYEKLEMQFSRHPTIKETVARDFCFELRLWGFRLGPTNVPHPLLTSVHYPFNML